MWKEVQRQAAERIIDISVGDIDLSRCSWHYKIEEDLRLQRAIRVIGRLSGGGWEANIDDFDAAIMRTVSKKYPELDRFIGMQDDQLMRRLSSLDFNPNTQKVSVRPEVIEYLSREALKLVPTITRKVRKFLAGNSSK